MNEDTTRDMHTRSFEERIFSELSAMRAEFNARFDAIETRLATIEARMTTVENRLTTLEDKVDARLRETRPIWEGVQLRLDKIDPTLKEMSSHLKLLARDSFQLRARVEELEEHLPPAA